MLLRMPAPPAVSTMRGVALPSRGSSVVPFRIIAPIASDEKPSTASNSVPHPYVPDATRIGVVSSSPAMRTVILILSGFIPDHLAGVEHGPLDAHAFSLDLPPCPAHADGARHACPDAA